MGNEAVKKATGMNEEMLSIIETRNSGFLISISRSVKVGKTAGEINTVKYEGHAKDQEEAKAVLAQIDAATRQWIVEESKFYDVQLKQTPVP